MAVERTWTDEDVKALVRRTRAEQGLPPKITDTVVLDSIVAILADHDAERKAAS